MFSFMHQRQHQSRMRRSLPAEISESCSPGGLRAAPALAGPCRTVLPANFGVLSRQQHESENEFEPAGMGHAYR